MRFWLPFLLTILPAALLRAQPPASEDQFEFADSLTSILHEANSTSGTSDNALTSALGVSMAFSLVYPSMSGNAAIQTQSVFGYPSSASTELVWNATQEQLGANYSGKCLQQAFDGGEGDDPSCSLAEPTIRISNVIWVDTASTVNPNYTAVVGESLELLNFSSQTAGNTVNAWVNNATEGLIPELVASGPLAPLVLLAVNAIYLKASWYNPFSALNTNQDFFYTSPSKTTALPNPVNFMHMVEYFPYSDQLVSGYQILQLPFAVQSLSMVVVFPVVDSRTSTSVSSSTLIPLLPLLSRTRVALGIPKFKLAMEYADTLKAALKKLGVVAPFDGGLCVFAKDCSSAIQTIIQKTFISVDEEGVEAAAVTGIAVGTSFPTDTPVEVLLDHPFQFFIVEDLTGVVVFEGKLGSPELVDSNAPLLAQHSDSDFWTSNNFGLSADPIQVVPTASATNTTNSTTSNTTTTTKPLWNHTYTGPVRVTSNTTTPTNTTSTNQPQWNHTYTGPVNRTNTSQQTDELLTSSAGIGSAHFLDTTWWVTAAVVVLVLPSLL